MPENKPPSDKSLEREEIKLEEKTWEETKAPVREEEVIIDPAEILLEWKAREFIQFERHPSWYLAGGFIAAILLIIAVATLNFLFALIIIMIGLIIYIYTQKTPEYLNVQIAKTGMKINKRFFSYGDEISAFWILYKPPELKNLHFERKSTVSPNLVIELEDMDPIKVREILLKYLPEDTTQEEKASDRISRKLGF